jgi:ribosomal subunit interface protein
MKKEYDMHKTITFRNEKHHTQPNEDQINSELEKIERFLKNEPTPVYVDVVVDSHDVHAYNRVSVRVKTPHYDCFADAKGDDLHAAINDAINKMYNQLRDEKEKITDSHTKGCGKACQAAYIRKHADENT